MQCIVTGDVNAGSNQSKLLPTKGLDSRLRRRLVACGRPAAGRPILRVLWWLTPHTLRKGIFSLATNRHPGVQKASSATARRLHPLGVCLTNDDLEAEKQST